MKIQTEKWECNVCGLPCRISIDSCNMKAPVHLQNTEKFQYKDTCICREDRPDWKRVAENENTYQERSIQDLYNLAHIIDHSLSSGTGMIVEERIKQIKVKGFDGNHDDSEHHQHEELKHAAMFLLTGDENYYPDNWIPEWKEKFSKKTKIQKLIVAGALIAAQIDFEFRELKL